MKIALVIPRNTSENDQNFYDLKFVSSFLLSKKHFAYLLAIPTLVSLTPPEHEVRVFDENIEDIDYSWDADLAGITVRTMFANRAYEISRKFRERGVKTVLGGIHPSMCTEESLQHCDSVVIGEAEYVWQTLLKDAREGKLKRTYEADRKTDVTTGPIPDRSVLSHNRYLSDILQTTKGCPFNCEFCSVYAFDGQRIRNKKVEQVVDEINAMSGALLNYKKKAIFIADDNIIANKKFSRELFIALKPLKIKWSCQASINIAKEDELLSLMKESGCGAMLVGLESISEENLAQMNKGVNIRHDYIDAIKKIQSYGMLVHGSFIVGYDFDTEESFDELIEFIDEAHLLMPLVNVLTPYPGTKLFKRLEEENRIIHKDWSKYDSKHVVFRPALLTPEQLHAGYSRVIKHLYSFDSIYKRLRYFMDMDFWGSMNRNDPIKLRYRMLFAARMLSMVLSSNLERSRFIVRILPSIFKENVRVSTILTLMAYNDYACSS